MVIEHLCLYEGQELSGLLASPVTMVMALYEGAVRKHKKLKRR